MPDRTVEDIASEISLGQAEKRKAINYDIEGVKDLINISLGGSTKSN